VLNWFSLVPDTDKYISVMTIGEIVRGIEKLSDATKQRKLSIWLNNIIYDGFSGRIVNFDIDVMTVWGKLQAKLPRTLPIQDSLIAAAALTRNMTIATRNVKDFEGIPNLKIFNPWKD
ncbi:MAG: type II toxin-antitoxin system VapC family toxin, partial [Chitinivibrionia bacterium]|nr:type II toxin-antitoxin system VapC family toxin [Chitinivibrionia bacterium]